MHYNLIFVNLIKEKMEQKIKKTKKVKKIDNKYFDFYDDIKIDRRDTEW